MTDGSSPLRLVRFDEITEEAYLDYVAEWQPNGETDEPRARGYVPSTLFFLVDADGRLLGSASFRHELNDRLLLSGGHIGYGIRPSQRRQRLGTQQLRLVLDVARGRGLARVLITCDDANVASARTIEGAGGLLEGIGVVEGQLMRRYWVQLA